MRTILIILLALLSLASPVSANEPVLSIHLLDISGSQGRENKGSPYLKGLAVLKDAIKRASKRDKIIVLGFGKGSGQLLRAVMPKTNGPRQIKLKRARRAALAMLDKKIAERIKEIDRSSTDIIGAMLRAARLLKEDKGYSIKKRLYIYSDLLDTEHFQFGSLKSLLDKRVVDRAYSNIPELPDLRGIAVYCVNSIYYNIPDMNSTQREQAVERLISLWREILKRTHADKVKFETSY